jgi:hypothetical protein
MVKTPIQSGESSLKPKARLIKTIRFNSNNIVAIIELVKKIVMIQTHQLLKLNLMD